MYWQRTKAKLVDCAVRMRWIPAKQTIGSVTVDAVKRGDVIWDVGAGNGMLSEMFCRIVGDEGLVVAFEPQAELCRQILSRVEDRTRLRIENVALGSIDASREIVIRRGETVCDSMGMVPNVVHISVGSYVEGVGVSGVEDVLAGMGVKLASPTLRSIILNLDRKKLGLLGCSMAPIRVGGLLSAMGFRLKWIDGVHLFAWR